MSPSKGVTDIHDQISPCLNSFIKALEKSTKDIEESMEALKRYPSSEKTAGLVVRIAQASAEKLDQVQSEALQHVKKLDEDVDQVVRNLNQIQQQTTQLRDDAQTEKDKHKALNNDLEGRIRAYDERIKNIAHTDDQLKSVIPVFQQATSRLEQRENMTLDLTKQLEANNSNHDSLVQELRVASDKLRTENETLRNELETAKTYSVGLNSSLETVRSAQGDAAKILVDTARKTAIAEADEKSKVQSEKEKDLMRKAHNLEIQRMKQANEKLVDELKIEVQTKVKEIENWKTANNDAKIEVTKFTQIAEDAIAAQEESRRDYDEFRKDLETTRIKEELKRVWSGVEHTLNSITTVHKASDRNLIAATTELKTWKTNLETLVTNANQSLDEQLTLYREQSNQVLDRFNDTYETYRGALGTGLHDAGARKVLEELSIVKDENREVLRINAKNHSHNLKNVQALNAKVWNLEARLQTTNDQLTESRVKVENLEEETRRIPNLEAQIVNLTRGQQTDADLADQLARAQEDAAHYRQKYNTQHVNSLIAKGNEEGRQEQLAKLQQEIDQLKADRVREEVLDETRQQELAKVKEELAEHRELLQESERQLAAANTRFGVYDAVQKYVKSGKELTVDSPTFGRRLLKAGFVEGGLLPTSWSYDTLGLRAIPGSNDAEFMERLFQFGEKRRREPAQPSTPTIRAIEGPEVSTPPPMQVTESAVDPKRVRSKGNTPFTLAKKSRVSEEGEAVATKSIGSSTFVDPPPAMDQRLQREIDHLAQKAREEGVSNDTFLETLRRQWNLNDSQLAQALQEKIVSTGEDDDTADLLGDVEVGVQEEAGTEQIGASQYFDFATGDQGTTSSPAEITSVSQTSAADQPSTEATSTEQSSIATLASTTGPTSTGYGRWTMPAEFIGARRDFYMAIRKPANWDDTAEAALVNTLKDRTDLITATENLHTSPACYNRRAKRQPAMPANQRGPCDYCVANNLVCWGVRRLPNTAPPSRQKASNKKKVARTNWTANNGFYWEAIYRPERDGGDDGDGGSAGGDAPVTV